MRSLLTSDVEHLQFIMPRPTVLCCDPSVCLFVCFMPLAQNGAFWAMVAIEHQ